MTTDHHQPPQEPCRYYPAPYEEDEIDLLEYWNVIWGAKKFISLFTLGCTILAVIIVLILPVTYRSTAVLQPTTPDSGTMGKLSALAGSLPFSLGLPTGDTTGQKLMDFLSSRTLKERLLEKYDLLPYLFADDWDADKKKWKEDDPEDQPSIVKTIQDEVLEDIYAVSSDKKSELITISWVDEDPKFAATMLDRVINELNYYLDFEYETDAQRERVFIEEQLQKAKTELERWEQQVPNVKTSQAAITRELLASQVVYQEMRKQLELAKIQEAKQVISFKVLDNPFVPEIKYKPKRSLICALTLVASGFLAVLIVFFRVALQARRQEAGNEE